MPRGITIGRAPEVTTKTQKLKATVCLAEDFPLDLRDQVMPIIDLMVHIGVVQCNVECCSKRMYVALLLTQMVVAIGPSFSSLIKYGILDLNIPRSYYPVGARILEAWVE